MAYNKDNYDEYRLTPKQEKFVELIMDGKNQYEAYIEAYPKSRKWQRNTVDSRASVLMKNKKISKRLEEYKQIKQKKIEWTRERALNEINYVLDMNRRDMERMNQAYDDELKMKEAKLIELSMLFQDEKADKQRVIKKMNEINQEIVLLKQRRRTSAVNVNGILNAAKVLNRMYGYDITKVEIQTEDTERENMKALSVEELKAIAYSNMSNKGE